MRAMVSDELLKAVTTGAERSRRVAAVCGGAFLLGAVGLLDGRRATTHWMFLDELAQHFPEANVERDPIFVEDGPVFTSAGVTAGIDLALALVKADHGPAVARQIARYLVAFMQRLDGQAQFATHLHPRDRRLPARLPSALSHHRRHRHHPGHRAGLTGFTAVVGLLATHWRRVVLPAQIV
jgi:transcriptional regulator GlxA family with amidase domain